MMFISIRLNGSVGVTPPPDRLTEPILSLLSFNSISFIFCKEALTLWAHFGVQKWRRFSLCLLHSTSTALEKVGGRLSELRGFAADLKAPSAFGKSLSASQRLPLSRSLSAILLSPPTLPADSAAETRPEQNRTDHSVRRR